METNEYPKYISTNPTGKDLLDGRSQEKISAAIARHILEVDAMGETSELQMPRIIGVEGTWGSGKSNVLSHLEKENLKAHSKYKFFLYDAWANQEDLQRRTILEQITQFLITEEILTGTTTVRIPGNEQNGKENADIKKVTWETKLDMLMAKRVKNITRSESPLNVEFKMLTLALAVMPMIITLVNALKFDAIIGWGYFISSIIITILPLSAVIAIVAFNKGYCFKNLIQPYKVTKENKTSYQVVNESEPTIQEFSSWMSEISEGLGNTKLVVVFDNMDRLPAEKVKKLWSAIHSIFSTDNYKNIWCIIPFDFDHLSCAFGSDKDERETLTKYFIEKSFPVVYRVPEPIVIDYKKIFNLFFEQAFGKDSQDSEIINRCYRIKNTKPNIRSIITFINRMVTITKTTEAKLSPISIAVYLLKENDLLKNPLIAVPNSPAGKNPFKKVSTEEYILSSTYRADFIGIISLSQVPQKEIAALVYGIDPERAYQIPMKRALEDWLTNKDSKVNTGNFISHELFSAVLVEVATSVDASQHQLVSDRLASLKSEDLSEQANESLNRVWRYLARKYKTFNIKKSSYSSLEKNIIAHVKDDTQKEIAKHFCSNLKLNTELSGSALFDILNELFNEDCAENWDAMEICPEMVLSGERFIAYMQRAKAFYTNYPIKANKDEVVKYLSSNLDGAIDYTTTIAILNKDENYSVEELAEVAKIKLKEEKAVYSIAARLIAIIRIFKHKDDIALTPTYLDSMWTDVKQDYPEPKNLPSEYYELFTLIAITYPGHLQNEQLIVADELANKALFYTSTSKVIEDSLAKTSDKGIQSILMSSLVNKIADQEPQLKGGFVSKWEAIRSHNTDLSCSHFFEFAETWGYNSLCEEENKASIDTLLPSMEWIDEMLISTTHIAEVLTNKAIVEIKNTPSANMYNMSNLTVANTYSNKLLAKLVSKDKIQAPLGDNLNAIVVLALQLIAKNTIAFDDTINKLLLIACNDFQSISSKVNDIRRSIFRKEANYRVTVSNFPYLHTWLEKTDINSDGNIIDSADTILAPVVENTKCQQLILENKNIYESIIVKSQGHSSALHDKLKAIVNAEEDNEFKSYLNQIVKYEQPKK